MSNTNDSATWTVDHSDRDRTIWTRPGLDVMVETYETDNFNGYTVSYVSDGLPAGPTDAYQRFTTLEDAQRAAERFGGAL